MKRPDTLQRNRHYYIYIYILYTYIIYIYYIYIIYIYSRLLPQIFCPTKDLGIYSDSPPTMLRLLHLLHLLQRAHQSSTLDQQQLLLLRGEINTLAGNRNSIRTREALMTNSKAFGDAPLEARRSPWAFGSVSSEMCRWSSSLVGALVPICFVHNAQRSCKAFFPVDEDIGSDSALLDNVVELLLAAGAEPFLFLGGHVTIGRGRERLRP